VIISRGAAEDAEPSVVLGVDYRIDLFAVAEIKAKIMRVDERRY